jgi:hypothetical protein
VIASRAGRGFGPCRCVHQTLLHGRQIAIENTSGFGIRPVVHQYSFLWTLAAMRRREAQPCA